MELTTYFRFNHQKNFQLWDRNLSQREGGTSFRLIENDSMVEVDDTVNRSDGVLCNFQAWIGHNDMIWCIFVAVSPPIKIDLVKALLESTMPYRLS